MSFLFVDQILALEPGKSTLGLKHITPGEEYLLADKEGRFKIMPCIMGEALGQLCSWNAIKSSDFKVRMVGGIVGEVMTVGDAYIGDTLRLENTIDALDLDNQVISFHGQVTCNGKPVFILKNGLGPLLPLGDFSDVASIQREFSNLYRPQTNLQDIDQEIINNTNNIYNPVNAHARACTHMYYDKIWQWDQQQGVVAQKNLSLNAPYFTTHFPLKPVLPLTLLMESNLQLAYQFIAEMFSNHSELKLKSVRQIKMSGFALPGDSVITRLNIKSQQPQQIIVSFRNEVAGKKVCVAEAEFGVN